ncbi:MAG TPA: c-type cytochrome biogenesis protein CcmI [Casimicrobiaceae bacterium]|jgi:cytochrome c-type biogenesis protein CcmH
MTLLWPWAALLVISTLAVLVWPLLRAKTRGDALDADAASIAILRDQKRALDSERAAGEISDAERDAALTELARRVTEERGSTDTPASPRPKRAWWAALALIVVVPTAAFLIYNRLGMPDATVLAEAAKGHEVSEKQILAMVDTLAARLKQHPEDADGWILLGRSYLALERFPEAADAYAHANALINDDADLLADYADVLAMTQNRTLAGRPAALVAQALAIDPKNKKALALAATVALEAHDLPKALGYWKALAAELPPGSEESRQVAGFIAEITAQSPGMAATSIVAAPAANAPNAPRPSPPAAASAAAVVAPGGISGRVDIDPALASKVALNDTVFIYARAAEGPRMPLAILRVGAKELPREFTLDDSMGMGPGAKLSATPQVIVEARISKSGDAMPQSGDLFGRTTPVKPGARGLRVNIDQVVP